MTDEFEDFKAVASVNFVTARQMVVICLIIEIIVQSFSLIVKPTAWWTWQLLGFIVATNLGAVILAIFAQKSADDISKIYKKIFTPDFYYTVKILTDFRKMVASEAKKDNRNMDEELGDISMKVYALLRKYLDAKYAQDFAVPPELVDLGIEIENINIEEIDEKDLFNEA